LLAKVFGAGADAVVLDLEDAVAEPHKARARELVRRALEKPDPERPPVWVRINGLATDLWQDDVRAVVVPGLAGVRVPKAESPAALVALDAELERTEAAAGLERGHLRVTCTIESALGLAEARRLAEQPRVTHLAFGEADFAADVGAEPGFGTLWARSSLVVAARAAGVAPPIASAFTRLPDEDGLRRTTLEARRLGFFGRSCLHPLQVAVVHDVFTPSAHEIDTAHRVIQAYEAADSGVTRSGGLFVDAAVVRSARATIERAAAYRKRKS